MKKSSEISIKAIVKEGKKGPIIEVKKKAERIKKRFGFGNLNNDTIELSLEEALCLSEYFKIEFFMGKKKVKVEEILPSFRNSFIFRRLVVLKDLIRRGYKVKSGPSPFDVSCWKKGKRPEDLPPSVRVKVYAEHEFFSPFEIYELLRTCLFERKELFIAIVDGDAEVSYYKVVLPEISGSYSSDVKGSYEGIWTGEGVLITEGWKKLQEFGFGKAIGRFLHLSLEEAEYLREKGVLKAEFRIGDLSRYRVYKDLRERGTLPKSGYKFGGVFRVYCLESEEHSKYVVNPCNKGWKMRWCYLSSMVRTARGVKKKLVFGLDLEGDIKYVCLERIVPRTRRVKNGSDKSLGIFSIRGL